MKKIFNIVLFLSLCFFVKTQAQDNPWTVSEKLEVAQEIEWVNEVISLNDQQKDLLETVFLKKNRMIVEGIRVEWRKRVVFNTFQDIVRYGQYINRRPGMENIHLATEYVTQADFDEKIKQNEALLEKLSLNVNEN